MPKESSADFERTVTNWIQKHPLSVYYTEQDPKSFLSQEFNKIIESRYKAANQIVVSQEHAANLITKSMEDLKEAISEGFGALQSTFEWGVAEIVWTLEQQNKVLVDILNVLQTPLDTQAEELRKRGEYAFRHGWYEQAEKEFLNSEDKNPYDFSIHWNLGYIYLFHKPKPKKALKYFKNAAKYSTPKSTYYAANALRHVALIYYLQKEFELACETTLQATQLHPSLYEAYYEHAQYCSCLGKYDEAIQYLKIAVTQGNRLYLLKAHNEDDFNVMRGKIESLEKELRDTSYEAAKKGIVGLKKVLAEVESFNVEVKNVVIRINNLVEVNQGICQAKMLNDHKCYFDCLDAEKITIDAHNKLYADLDEDLSRTQIEQGRFLRGVSSKYVDNKYLNLWFRTFGSLAGVCFLFYLLFLFSKNVIATFIGNYLLIISFISFLLFIGPFILIVFLDRKNDKKIHDSDKIEVEMEKQKLNKLIYIMETYFSEGQ